MVRRLLMDPTLSLLLLLVFGLAALVVVVLCVALVMCLRLLAARPAASQTRMVARQPQPVAQQTRASGAPQQMPVSPRFRGERGNGPPGPSGPALEIDGTTGQMGVRDTSAELENIWENAPMGTHPDA